MQIRDSHPLSHLSLNYAQALRELRQTDDRLERLKKQIKADQVRASRGSAHRTEQERRSRNHQTAQAETERLKRLFLLIKKAEEKRVREIKEKSEKFKQQSIEVRSRRHLQFMEQKIRNSSQVRQMTVENMDKILSFRRELLQQRRQNWKYLYQRQARTKDTLQMLRESRLSQVRKSRNSSRDQILNLLKKRQKQLTELDELRKSRNLRNDQNQKTKQVKSERPVPQKRMNSVYLRRSKGRTKFQEKKSYSQGGLGVSGILLLT